MRILGFDINRSNNDPEKSELTKLIESAKDPSELATIVEQAVGTNKFLEMLNMEDYGVLEGMDSSSISKLSNTSSNRSTKFQLYDAMSYDTIISSALEMYADDSTQTDPDGRIVWVESEDPDLVKLCNDRLEDIDMESLIWDIYYSLAKYGECYQELYYSRSNNTDPEKTNKVISNASSKLFNNAEDSVPEYVTFDNFTSIESKPENILDIQVKGTTISFVKTMIDDKNDLSNSVNSSDIPDRVAYPPTKYVHYVIGNGTSRNQQKVAITVDSKSKGKRGSDPDIKIDMNPNAYQGNTNLGQPVRSSDDSFTILASVKEGKSILADIATAYKQLKLIEQVLLLNRLSRSSVIRMVNVEVGSMSKMDAKKALNRVRNKLSSKVAIDDRTGTEGYVDVKGMDNLVVIPTENGKGAIDAKVIGGDVDIKSLADLDHFSNRLFGGLKIPKAFLGYESDLGNNAGDTLAKLDIRYGRTIKKMQSSVRRGIKDMLDMYLKTKSYKVIPDYTVKVVSPVTVEDTNQQESVKSNLDAISSALDIINTSSDMSIDSDTVSSLLSPIIGKDSLNKLIDQAINKNKDKSDGTEEDGGEL